VKKDFKDDIKREYKEFKKSHHHHNHHYHHHPGFQFPIDRQGFEGQRFQKNFVARLVKHVTCDDGMEYSPNIEFEKIWRIRNDGTQVWPKGTKFLRVSMRCGNELNAPEFIELNEEVKPGSIIDIKVPMKTPSKEGCYENYWKMQLPVTDQQNQMRGGQKFGQRFRCQLNVAVISSDESSSNEEKKLVENNCNIINNDNNIVVDCRMFNRERRNCCRLNFDELEKKWNVQLMLLETLGFKKRKRMIKLLEKFQGDVNKVLNVIISHKQRESGVLIDIKNNTNNIINNETTSNDVSTVTKPVNQN